VFTDHKTLETLNKCHDKTMKRYIEAFKIYNFCIKVQKRSVMCADFVSRNTIDVVEIFQTIKNLKKNRINFANQ
jgi:hypothetical protein